MSRARTTGRRDGRTCACIVSCRTGVVNLRW
jgi:hypothetical protein